jgi:beta-glucanase (GH16 family)
MYHAKCKPYKKACIAFLAALVAAGAVAAQEMVRNDNSNDRNPATNVMAQDKMKTPERPGWTLVWADEFDVDGLPDPKKWGYEEGFIRGPLPQYYHKARKENSRVENGHLIIEARKERLPNPKFKEARGWRKREFMEYTSASLHTFETFPFTYGRVEVRAKLPKGNGAWPAIWMLGTSFGVGNGYVGKPEGLWPECGEIDIMEWWGGSPYTMTCHMHWKDPKSENRGQVVSKGATIELEKPPYDFHVYAMEWDYDKMDFFFDGKKYHTFWLDTIQEGPENVYRKPFYLLINLALGGRGRVIDDQALPMQYVIDYVRIYQKTDAEKPDDNSAH